MPSACTRTGHLAERSSSRVSGKYIHPCVPKLVFKLRNWPNRRMPRVSVDLPERLHWSHASRMSVIRKLRWITAKPFWKDHSRHSIVRGQEWQFASAFREPHFRHNPGHIRTISHNHSHELPNVSFSAIRLDYFPPWFFWLSPPKGVTAAEAKVFVRLVSIIVSANGLESLLFFPICVTNPKIFSPIF